MKKKKVKRLIALIVGMTLMLSNTVYALETESGVSSGIEALKKRIQEIEEKQSNLISSEKIEKQSIAIEEYGKLMRTIRNGEEYPSYYSGAYLNDDDELVIVLTGQSEETSQIVKEATGNSNIKIEYAEVSLNYLKNLQIEYAEKYSQYCEQIEAGVVLADSDKEVIEGFNNSSIDEINNQLVIGIGDLTEEKVEIFEKLFGSNNVVRFESCGKSELVAQPWKVGRTICSNKDGSPNYFSTGYRAYYIDTNGTRYNGFMTAAHAVSQGEYVYYSDSLTSSYILGQCKKSQFSGYLDSAFVAITNSFYEPSNQFYYTDESKMGTLTSLLNTYYVDSEIPVNTSVMKVGARTKVMDGKVLSNNHYENYSKNDEGEGGRTIFGLVKTSMYALEGDSGGAAFVVNDNSFTTAGTVVSTNFRNGLFEHSCYCQIRYEIDYLHIVKY